MLRNLPFVKPMLPVPVSKPPAGPEWQHEIKLDGFRVQIHAEASGLTLFTRNGHDATRRYRRAIEPLQGIRRAAILDAELIACGEDGQPDFHALMRYRTGSKVPLCLLVFDLLRLDGESLLARPLAERQARLADVLADIDDQGVQISAAFDDGAALLASAEKLGLEGIVSKRRDSRYRSGPSRSWLKCKTPAWRADNKWRHEAFAR